MKAKVDLTPLEKRQFVAIADRIQELRDFLEKHHLSADGSRVDDSYRFLNRVKDIIGNWNNDLSFVATLLAKQYLLKKHPELHLDVASKSQSAPGLDIDARAAKGRVVAEIKTVYPYLEADFGSAQRDSFLRDFEKLVKAKAEFKYLLLSEPEAFSVVKTRYRDHVRGITVVSLLDGAEFSS